MAVPDFSKIWASQSSLNPYEFDDANYFEGWEFIGEIPPNRRMFDTWQRQADTKMQWLFQNAAYLIRKNSTEYEEGDIAFSQNLASALVLECVKGGITATAEPDFSGATVGATVEDGTVKWRYQPLIGGDMPLGAVAPFLQTSIPDGWLSCENGQEVSRTAYPELWAWVQTNAPLITEAQWQTKAAAQKSVGYYSSGDGSTTFRLPRLVGFMEGVTAANVGAFTGAGLPNIVGDYAQSYIGSGQNAAAIMGAFTADATVQNADFQLNAAPGNTVFNGINFSASRSSAIYGNSDTVQPESVGLVWCVRAFGAATNQGTVDITELAQMLNLKLSIADAPRVCTPFAFPSDTWVAIPLPSAYSTYVAPADGYVFATGVPISDSIPAYAAVSIKDGNGNYILRNISHSVFAANSSGAFLQVRKGDTVYIDIVNSNNGTAKFIYAQGEV